MNKKTKNQLYAQALEQWGGDAQCLLAIEEMSELTLALTHAFRDRAHNVTEEIADVVIMCEQLAIMFGETEVERFKRDKLKRLKTRLNFPPNGV